MIRIHTRWVVAPVADTHPMGAAVVGNGAVGNHPRSPMRLNGCAVHADGPIRILWASNHPHPTRGLHVRHCWAVFIDFCPESREVLLTGVDFSLRVWHAGISFVHILSMFEVRRQRLGKESLALPLLPMYALGQYSNTRRCRSKNSAFCCNGTPAACRTLMPPRQSSQPR